MSTEEDEWLNLLIVLKTETFLNELGILTKVTLEFYDKFEWIWKKKLRGLSELINEYEYHLVLYALLVFSKVWKSSEILSLKKFILIYEKENNSLIFLGNQFIDQYSLHLSFCLLYHRMQVAKPYLNNLSQLNT